MRSPSSASLQFWSVPICSRDADVCCNNTKIWLTKHLCRSHPILELKWLGSWAWLSILMQSVLIGANLLVTFYRFTDIKTAAQRAGEVAIVNMAAFYPGPHLSYQAGCLHVSLSRMKSIYRGITWSFVLVMTFRIAVLKPTQSVSTSGLPKQFHLVIVCCSNIPLLRGRCRHFAGWASCNNSRLLRATSSTTFI